MNAQAHRLVAGGVAALYLGHEEQKRGAATAAPLAGGFACSVLTALPDIIEPATSPHHRQFFHSFAFAALLVGGFSKLKQWDPQTPEQDLLRKLGMLAIAGYLIHLALDATTKKSLPLFGKL